MHTHTHACAHTHSHLQLLNLANQGPLMLTPTYHLVHSQSHPQSCCHPFKPCSVLDIMWGVREQEVQGGGGKGEGGGKAPSRMQLPTDHTLPQAPLLPFPCKAYEGRASSSPSSLKLATGEGLCRTLSNRERAETLTLSMGGKGPSLNTVFKCSQCP